MQKSERNTEENWGRVALLVCFCFWCGCFFVEGWNVLRDMLGAERRNKETGKSETDAGRNCVSSFVGCARALFASCDRPAIVCLLYRDANSASSSSRNL